ncbi:MAG TPA: ABC transporter ATP-binding protein [Anaerolineales bacterium]|nr:ABC transporter ATP-binding protein [Anaerolineales bacterium]
MDGLIQARGLRRRFGDILAVDGVDLTVRGGEVVALIGPDGAGKTTTMRLLCGVLRADEGQVRLGGIDLATDPDEARGLVGYLPQRFSLYGELTVEENLHFLAEVRGLPRHEWRPRSLEILEFVDMADVADRRAEALSGGMRQKLGLAAALVHRPQILILDEPTGGVDPVTRQLFWQLLIRLLQQGVGVLVSTPYMDEAARCGRLVFMNRGRVILEGAPGELRNRLEGQIVEVLGEPIPALRKLVAGDPRVQDIQRFGDRLHLRIPQLDLASLEADLKARSSQEGVRLSSVRAIPAGLEDVFLDLLQAEGAAT